MWHLLLLLLLQGTCKIWQLGPWVCMQQPRQQLLPGWMHQD
jgi:hypothetical protein